MPGLETQLSYRKARIKSNDRGRRRRGEKKGGKACRHTKATTRRKKKRTNSAGKSSRRRVLAPCSWSFHGHRASELRTGRGERLPFSSAVPCLLRTGVQAEQSCQLRAQAAPVPTASAPRGQGTSHFNGGTTAAASFFPSPSPRCLPPLPTPAPLPTSLLRLTYRTAAWTNSGRTGDRSVKREGDGLMGGKSVSSRQRSSETTCERHQHVRLPV